MSAVLQEKPNLYPGWDKYNIWDPNHFVPAERTPFLRSICKEMEHKTAIEEIVEKYKGYDGTGVELRQLAQWYITLKNKGARVPNFTRWVTGMFAGNKAYADFLAKEGQKAASRKILMSCEPVDILRSADTKHFNSCFKKTTVGQVVDRRMMRNYAAHSYDQYQYMPAVILEDCPGIGIALVDDEQGQMMGRQWIHHAKVTATDEDIVVLTNAGYGCLQGQMIVDLLFAQGIRTAYQVSDRPAEGWTEITFIGCLKDPKIHHDLPTWYQKSYARIMQPLLTKAR